ncbi:MAG: hypothetical protein ABII22_02410 [Candidatus Micrarchaeota archaeon]
MGFLELVIDRFFVLVQAPLESQQLLWAATPLVIATLFMTLYFGKYSKEELGWNTAFGNTMVFLFVSINLIHFMYYSTEGGSMEVLSHSNLYFSITIGLVMVALFFMIVTYYHLLPKKVAFFLFSAPPVNVSVYVLMVIIYLNLPADEVTLVAGAILLVIIFAIVKVIQTLEHAASKPDGVSLSDISQESSHNSNVLAQLKKKNKIILEKKKQLEQETKP